MRPVEFQPPIVQTPNVERVQQQQQGQPQVTQQTFAGQLQQVAEQRPHQVQQLVQSGEATPGKVKPEERGERRGRRPGRRRTDRSAKGPAAPEPAGTGEAKEGGEKAEERHVDVRV